MMIAPDKDQIPSEVANQLILASSDSGWYERIRASLTTSEEFGFFVLQLDTADQIEVRLRDPATLWLVDEDWLEPVMAYRHCQHRNEVTGANLIVRFKNFSIDKVVAAIESGADGCLSNNASAEEAKHAIQSVLKGEMWLSRRVFSQVLKHMQNHRLNDSPMPEHEGLTERQREIVACVARGLSNKQIGRQLGISPTTVKTHLHNIFERLEISGRTLLALRASNSDIH